MSEFRRQHPIVMVTGVFDQLKSFIFPFLIVLIFALFGEEVEVFEGVWVLYFALVSIGFSIVAGVLKWLFFKYHIGDEAIEIRSGVIIKKQRHIKRERIQTVSLEARLWHRVFNLTSLKVETAGNLSESEVQIQALSRAEAEHIRYRLIGKPHIDVDATEAQKVPAIVVSGLTLFKAGLTSGSVSVVMLIMLAFLGQIVFFLPAHVFDRLLAVHQRLGLIAILIALSLFVLSAWVIAVVRFVIRYAYFSLKLEGEDLLITRGLIVQKTLNIKRHRIQSVMMTQGLLRQPFGYVTIEVKAAGGRSDESLTSTLLHPLIKQTEVAAFLALITPQVRVHPTVEPIPKRALIRYMIRNVAGLIIIIPLSFFSPWFLLLGAGVPVMIGLALMQHAHAGSAIDDTQLTLQMRTVAKKWVMTPKVHIQALAFRRSVMQRWRRLATVSIHVLAAPSAVTFTVRDLGVETQKELYDWMSKGSEVRQDSRIDSVL